MKMIGRTLVICKHVFAAFISFMLRMLCNLFSRREKWQTIVGRTTMELFISLGPAYVKLGQILSTRRDLVNPHIIEQLEQLQDRVPAAPFSFVSEVFQKEFGLRLDDVFSEIDPRPIGSASISSVYRGRLRNGKMVAVKIRRPRIVGEIKLDMKLLRLGAECAVSVPPLRHLPVLATLDEFRRCVERQLDFRMEAEANKRFRVAFRNEPHILIPELVEQFCSQSILTMDFIDEIAAPSVPAYECQRKALLLSLRALYYMIFVEGFIHCDMHQGNLHLLPGGRAALIDFGFISELKDFDRQVFAEFFYAVSSNKGERCAQLIIETASYLPPGLCYERFEHEISGLIDDVTRTTAGKFHVADFVLGIFDIQRRHKIVGTTASFMAIISLLVFEGLTKHLYPDLDFQREALPFILPIILSPPRRRGDAGSDNAEQNASEGVRVLGVVQL